MEKECLVCKTKTDVKTYGYFCGIQINYCKRHNVLFKDITKLSTSANGFCSREKKNNEIKSKQRRKYKDLKWKTTI